MYYVEVFYKPNERTERKLLGATHYFSIENVISDICSNYLFYNLQINEKLICEKGNMDVSTGNKEGDPGNDFRFSFANGLVVYAGIPIMEDEERRIE